MIEDSGVARKPGIQVSEITAPEKETTWDTARRTPTGRAVARHQKEDHLVKGVYKGTKNTKQRENEKRNEQAKEKPNGETSQMRGHTREPKKSPKEKAGNKRRSTKPEGTKWGETTD